MIWFDGWWTLARVVVFGVLAFGLLVALIRGLGQRTIANMNASDFVITVAIGSAVATLLLSRDASFAEGAVAVTLLLSLNAAVEWTSTRRSELRERVEGRPKIVFYEGEFVHEVMLREHVNEGEIRAAMRQRGVRELDQVHAVVLEISGALSVLTQRGAQSSLLDDVVQA
jgi:uncharacterized membrane protein YcaP (DUF421 family)